MNFIIYAYKYNDDSGGTVVLHKLCHLLNQLGYDAKLWPNYKPEKHTKYYFFKLLKYYKKKFRRKFLVNPKWNTPLATQKDLKSTTLVIYAEVVDGNPLNAQNIVRWLLHKPGFHTHGKINYTSNELYFYYLKSYVIPSLNIEESNELYLPNNREDTYFQNNFGSRNGSCYILRKGKKRTIVHDLTHSILIDGKSHDEISKIFNDVEFCISYDTYTMYSVYASMCGCKSIIVPEDSITKEQWCPDINQSYGLAYGFDDIEYAEATKKLLFERFEKENLQTLTQLKIFIEKCHSFLIDNEEQRKLLDHRCH